MPAMTVHVSHRPGPGPGATVVRIAGSLEADTTPRARTQLEPLIASAPRVVVLDLGELTFLSSVGISLILDLQRQLAARGTKVFLTNLQPQIEKVMAIVQALPPTSVFKSIAELDDYLAEIQRRVTDGEGA